MKVLQKIITLIGFSLAFLPNLSAQNAIAVSSNPGPGLHVALNWSPSTKAVGYNIFRRGELDPGYPVTPLNPLPILPVSNCSAIKSLLITAPDSAAWKMVANFLADSLGIFNPCLMNTMLPQEKYNRLMMLTKRNMPIAKAAGLGYEDKTVTLAKVYYYKIVALDAANKAIADVAADLKITAGSFVLPPPPASVIAEPGDAMVQVRWEDVKEAAGFIIERSTNPAGIYVRVNPGTYSSRVKNHLNGDTLIPSAEGMVDFQYYHPTTGKPVSHLVAGSLIPGPYNGTNYFYRIRSIDFFQRAGVPSVVSNAAMPKDTTKPSVANDIVATPDTTGKVTIRWTQVTKDINGHWEQPDSSMRYRVYRFASSDDPTTSPSVLVGEVATLKGLQSKDTVDADPNLRGPYGNKTWWYRIRTVDKSGNVSSWSSAVSAIVKDNTPPGIVMNTTAKGFEDHIQVKWKLNSEPDMASYMVYRSLCHLGNWVECNPNDTCRQWTGYDPLKGSTQNDNKDVAGVPTTKTPCPCSGPFVFLGEITHDSAKRAEAASNFYFDDRTIPKGSPLCYAYWIKAKDSSGNLCGTFPLPSPAERTQIFCQRLRDLTPPEPALISGLFAQADQMKVEWMGPPTQDTRAYHVYRADGKDPAVEPVPADYKWVGGMTVELPPTLPKVLTQPYTPPSLAPCDKISVQATQWMSQGRFEDKTINPKKTYWYKVAGIDYDGNETPLIKAAAISTFTFSKLNQPAPVLMSITKLNGPCRVVLQWLPTFDPNTQMGFIVYRSSSAAGPFTPIVISPLKANSFIDEQVVQGVTYWYRIALMMKNGRLSELTTAQSITP